MVAINILRFQRLSTGIELSKENKKTKFQETISCGTSPLRPVFPRRPSGGLGVGAPAEIATLPKGRSDAFERYDPAADEATKRTPSWALAFGFRATIMQLCSNNLGDLDNGAAQDDTA